ncbi:MAG TPA: BON domain-containing protein [Roseiflexaceae bacterium]|nr:BON domain-containing protein [Roseiflexaceae bacterium]
MHTATKRVLLAVGALVGAVTGALALRKGAVRDRIAHAVGLVQHKLGWGGTPKGQATAEPLDRLADAQALAGATEPQTTLLSGAAEAARAGGAPETAIRPVAAPQDGQTDGRASVDIEHMARSGHNAVAHDKLDRTLLDAQDLAPRADPDAGELEHFGNDQIISDRVSTRLGRELNMHDLPRLNINTQQNGVVYLRGTVLTAEQRDRIQEIVESTEGVQSVVNEIQIEQERGA